MKAKKEMFETEVSLEKEAKEGVRINKFLADAGVCSRRAADTAITEGKVKIDGEPALMGSKVLPGQEVTYCGQPVKKVEDLVLIAFNKPVGVVCTTNHRDPDNIIDYIKYEKRIYPIGRLDKESEGLILLTNDGNIVNKILRAGNYHEKEYIVTVNKDITPEFLHAMAAGVPILDTVTRPCKIEQIDRKVFRIILTQGLNRQIRRMCEALNYRVLALTRVRIMNICLNRLKPGNWRNVTPAELETLQQLIAESSNTPTDGTFHESEGEVDSEEMNESVSELKARARRRISSRNSHGTDSVTERPGSFSGRNSHPAGTDRNKVNFKKENEVTKHDYRRKNKPNT